ncbi:MAG: AraC family transcriptional regulator ligand-binding domain-containing protein [Polyangiales bacterium]
MISSFASEADENAAPEVSACWAVAALDPELERDESDVRTGHMRDSKRPPTSNDSRRIGISTLLGRALLANLAQLGIDAEAVREIAGVEAERLADPRERLSHREVATMFEEAERIGGDRTISLQVAGKAQTLAGGGVLGPLFLSSSDGAQALDYLVQYGDLLAGGLRVEPHRLEGDWIVRFFAADVELELLSRMMECLLAVAVRAFELSLNTKLQPSQVSFRHAAPPDVEPFRRFFGCDVYFDAEYYELCLPERSLGQSAIGAHPRIVEQLQEMAESELRLVSPRFTTAVRERIVVLFEQEAQASRAHVAKAMKLTERTLQRRLAEEGTTFREVVDGVRLDRASALLRDPSVRVADVAYAVGYDEVTSFTKAFRRWTGESPTAFRARHQGH